MTYWPHFLLNAYEERHNASYKGVVDPAMKTVLWLHLAVNEKSQRRYGTHSKQQQVLPEKYMLHTHMYLDTN